MKNDHDFQDLVQAYIEGQATAEQVEQLNQILRVDPAARQWFRELLNIDAALMTASRKSQAESEANTAPSLSDSGVPVRVAAKRTEIVLPANRKRRHWQRISLAVAASLVVALCCLNWWSDPPAFATIENAAGVAGLSAGMKLGPETYRIDAGTAELVTRYGARIVIEAPALFHFESAQRLQLEHGRLAADVPPEAHGFTVITPTGQAIDLGTKFGVDMPEKGEAEIHVFQGEVVAQSTSGGNLRNLHDGEAFRLQSAAGALRSFRSAAFIQPGEVNSLHAALQAGQPSRAQLATEKLRDDPALIAMLDFESNQQEPGEYRMVQGRWPGSQAVEFVNANDHMKLDVGGERLWPQLTLAAWVRLDHLGDPYHSLLHTDGWESEKSGQVHWMVTQLMTMRLALRNNTLAAGDHPAEGFPDSRTSVLPQQGRWVHLAAVYDSDKKSVRFYFNGKFDNETKLDIAFPARLGPAQIGNWNANDRRLSGRIDEMLILGRTLSDSELESLFAAGNPYR